MSSTRLVSAALIAATFAILLQHLARDVEREVRRIDDAADEAQIQRQKLAGPVGDEDAPHVELDAARRLPVPQVERRRRTAGRAGT